MTSNRVSWVVGAVAVAAMLLLAPLLFVREPNPAAVLETSMGTIKIELNRAKAPISVENFIKYAEAKHYDGTIFHRVISNFMIQGGGYDHGEFGPKERKDRFPPIKNESDNGLKNDRYTVAMARTNDPDSATAQFFINVKDNPKLNPAKDNPGYAVFGIVVEGMDVVDRIRQVKTGVTDTGIEDVPLEPIFIKSVRIER